MSLIWPLFFNSGGNRKSRLRFWFDFSESHGSKTENPQTYRGKQTWFSDNSREIPSSSQRKKAPVFIVLKKDETNKGAMIRYMTARFFSRTSRFNSHYETFANFNCDNLIPLLKLHFSNCLKPHVSNVGDEIISKSLIILLSCKNYMFSQKSSGNVFLKKM